MGRLIMTKIANLFLLLCLLSSPLVADDCVKVSDANAIYKSITQSNASSLSIKRLQQIVGVNADGIWGVRSDTAYNNLISKCNSYSYPGLTISVDGAKITDFYKVAIAKHGLATKEFYSGEKWTSLLRKQNFKDIIIEDITINVASVLPEWIKLIKTNEHKLLPLYPKVFLTMLCKCLQYAADKKENSIFGYVIIRAKK